MTFRIEISPRAREDIVQIANYIRRQSSKERASIWKKGLLEAVKTLNEMPFRCPMAEESDDLRIPVRELHYKSH